MIGRFDPISILRELISQDTTPKYGKTLGTARLLSEKLERVGFETTVLKNGRNANLLASYGKHPSLCFAGHMDTVDADFEKWSSDPLKAREKNGKIYGLGACDMKSGISAFISACGNLFPAMKNGVKILLTHSEETDFSGALSVPPEFFKGVDKVIIAEPTSCEPYFGNMGFSKIRIRIMGKECHSAYPEYGENAILNSLTFLSEFNKKISSLVGVPGKILPPTTINIAKIRGGIADNIIPGEVYIDVSFRSNDSISGSRFMALSENICSSFGKAEIVSKSETPCFSGGSGDLSKYFLSKFGGSVKTKKGTTEASVYSKYVRDIVIFGPGNISSAHSPDEFVEESQIKLAYSEFSDVVRKFC